MLVVTAAVAIVCPAVLGAAAATVTQSIATSAIIGARSGKDPLLRFCKGIHRKSGFLRQQLSIMLCAAGIGGVNNCAHRNIPLKKVRRSA